MSDNDFSTKEYGGQEGATALQNKEQAYPWIKVYTENLTNYEFMGLDDDLIGLYFKLYLLAARGDAGGLICDSKKALDIKAIAWHLRETTQELEGKLQGLVDTKFLIQNPEGWSIARFMDEQGPGPGGKLEEQREKWRVRQQRHRENIRIKEIDVKNLEGETETDKEGERDIECHGEITVTQSHAHTLTPTASSSATAKPIEAYYIPLGKLEGKKDELDCGEFSEIETMLEFCVNYYDALNRQNSRLEKIDLGYFKITQAGIDKIREFFDHDVTSIDKEKLANCIDFRYWLCKSQGSDLFDIEAVLNLYRFDNLERERLKNPQVYADTPQVDVVRQITNQEPDKMLYPKIYETIGEVVLNPYKNMETMAAYYTTWIGRGYNSNNYDWLFDWWAQVKDVWNYEEARQ